MLHVEGVPRSEWAYPEAEVDPGKRLIRLLLTVAEAETFALTLRSLVRRLRADRLTDEEYRIVAGPVTLLAIRARVQRRRTAEEERHRNERVEAMG